jgi:hypothetical protein
VTGVAEGLESGKARGKDALLLLDFFTTEIEETGDNVVTLEDVELSGCKLRIS